MRTTPLLLAAAVLVLPSCGGGGGGNTGPTPVTTLGVQRADISITQTATAQVCSSPAKNFRVGVPVEMAETAGLGFFVNYAEMLLLRSDGSRVEGTQIGADDVTRVAGSNHFAARSTTRFVVLFDFNNVRFEGVQLTFDFTDDRGNHVQSILNRVSPVVATQTCAF
jgi:hypothetical protein